MQMANSVRAALWTVDKDQPVWKVRTQESLIERWLGLPKFLTQLMTSYAMLALLLAAVGVYGVVSYAVEQRTDEMSVRIAVGATPAQVVLLMVRTGMLWSGVGIAIGLLAASWLGQLLATLLFEVREDDPATFISVALVLATVALSACYFPARRASRVDALATLRCG